MRNIKEIKCEAIISERGSNQFTCTISFINIKEYPIEILDVELPNIYGIERQKEKLTEIEEARLKLSKYISACRWTNNKEYRKKYLNGLLLEFDEFVDGENKWKDKLQNLRNFFENKYKEKVKIYFDNLELKVSDSRSAKSIYENFIKKEKSITDESKKSILIKIEHLEELEKIFDDAKINESNEILEHDGEYFRKYNFTAKRDLFKAKEYVLNFKLCYKKAGDKKEEEKNSFTKNVSTTIKIAPPHYTMLPCVMLSSIIGIIFYFASRGEFSLFFINELYSLENIKVLVKVILTVIASPFIYLFVTQIKKDNYYPFRYNMIYALMLGLAAGLLHNKIFEYLSGVVKIISGIQ